MRRMQHLHARTARLLVVAALATATLLVVGATPSGAGSDLLSGPPGSVLTITLSGPCLDGEPAAALLDGDTPLAFEFGDQGTNVVQIAVPDDVAPGTTLTIKSACLTYSDTIDDPDQSFLVTDGASGSFSTPGGTVGITTSAGTLSALSAGPIPAGAPAGVDFPFGLLSFTVTDLTPGATVNVSLTQPTATSEYWKYDEGVWSKFAGATFSGTTVQLTLTDGGAGDQDGTVNGVIVDPGAPGVNTAATPVAATPRFTG